MSAVATATGVVAPGPDTASAMRCEQAFRRISYVCIDLRAGDPSCTVKGVGHRIPISRQVALPTALGLVERGFPFIVHRPSEPEGHA